MAFSKEISEIIQSIDDVIVILWDIEKGWNLINNNGGLLGDQLKLEDGLKSLMSYVADEDRETYQIFYDRIHKGMKGTKEFIRLKENRLAVSVHLQEASRGCFYCNVECFCMKNAEDEIIRMTVIVCEMSAAEIYRQTLAQNITNDRTPKMFIQVASEVIHKNPELSYALVQFDVVKFKAINQMYGESFGDELLNYFIESLRVICDKDQLFVRLTADVFMILTSYETRQDLLDFVNKLNDSLLNYKDVVYRLVFGVAIVENLNERLRIFGDRAALARQSIKTNALEYVAFYEKDMTKRVLNGKYLEDHMEQALANHEFVMYLQPKYSISTGRMVGAEALVRWNSPERGLVSPAEFIPVFEKNGFIKKMDAFIWEEACKVIHNWMAEGITPLPVSVNVSRLHLKDNHFIAVLNHLVETYRIPKEYLEIEITETIEEGDTLGGIQLLKEQGYTLLMDDFGSGYSSLNTLKDTQFDVIKIDRSFLQDFIGSDRGQKIVEHTIKMTNAIGLNLVAEGVETQEQAQFLLGCGCDVAQGFYYAKPMALEDFQKKMREDAGCKGSNGK